MRVMTKMRSLMEGSLAKPSVLRPHIATAWLPAASCSSLAADTMVVFWSGPTSSPRILQGVARGGT